MNYNPDERGYYGEFGGAFIPEMMYQNVKELGDNYLKILNDKQFRDEFQSLLMNYVGRPSPLFFASRLSSFYSTRIFLKREDLNHTGAHKINNGLCQSRPQGRWPVTHLPPSPCSSGPGVAS